MEGESRSASLCEFGTIKRKEPQARIIDFFLTQSDSQYYCSLEANSFVANINARVRGYGATGNGIMNRWVTTIMDIRGSQRHFDGALFYFAKVFRLGKDQPRDRKEISPIVLSYEGRATEYANPRIALCKRRRSNLRWVRICNPCL